MKHLLLICALICAASAIAQESIGSPSAFPFSRVLLGINASADYCFRNMESMPARSAIGTAPWSDEDQPKFGYSAGLKMQYNFTAHWGLGVGAQYATRGYALERTSHWIMVDPFDSVIPGTSNYRYDHSFIDIPIRLIFQAGRKRVRFTASMGVAGNVLLNVSMLQTLTYEDGHVVRNREDVHNAYRAVNLSVIGSMGAVLQFNERSSLQLEPTFRSNLFPINESATKPTLRSAGLDLTFFYALR